VQIVGVGSGATATAVVSNGMVTAVNIVTPGSGYSNVPVIQIAPPTPVTLNNQTNQVLNLTAVSPTNAGSYFVVVTNAYGNATSSMATLTVILPPQHFKISWGGGSNGLLMQLSGTPGWPYVLQATTNLTPVVNWLSLTTNFADTNGNWTFTDTNLPLLPVRFYRANAP
jgi:hypothetical protein